MGYVNTGLSEMAGFRTRTAADIMNMNSFQSNNIGHWETFEKGIGSKILKNVSSVELENIPCIITILMNEHFDC